VVDIETARWRQKEKKKKNSALGWLTVDSLIFGRMAADIFMEDSFTLGQFSC
jgi:hypothetical protein